MRKFIIFLLVVGGLVALVWMLTGNGKTSNQASDVALEQITFTTEPQGKTGEEDKMQVLVTIANTSDKQFSGNIKISSLNAGKESIDFANIAIDNLSPHQSEEKLIWLKTAIVPVFIVKATEGNFK